MVDERFAKFLVQERERFLYFWKLNISVLNGVNKLSAFKQFLEGFKLQLKSEIGTNDRPLGLTQPKRLNKTHMLVLDEIRNDKRSALNIYKRHTLETPAAQ